MRFRFLYVLTMSLGLTASTLSQPVHHAFSANYDAERMVTLKGVVTRFDWKNPHALLYLDETKAETKDSPSVVHWILEGGSLGWLVQVGWRKETLKPGDIIGVCGYPAKGNRPEASVELVTLSNGETLPFSGEMRKCEETYHLLEP